MEEFSVWKEHPAAKGRVQEEWAGGDRGWDEGGSGRGYETWHQDPSPGAGVQSAWDQLVPLWESVSCQLGPEHRPYCVQSE